MPGAARCAPRTRAGATDASGPRRRPTPPPSPRWSRAPACPTRMSARCSVRSMLPPAFRGERAAAYRRRPDEDHSRGRRWPESRARGRCSCGSTEAGRGGQAHIYEPPRFFEALLRGRELHRTARHHGPDLRDLPGRLPDELGATRWRRRAGSRSAVSPGAPPAALLRRVDREPRAPHYMLHAPTSSATRARSRWRATTGHRPEPRSSSRRAGNAMMERRGRPRRPPGQRESRRIYRAPRMRELRHSAPQLDARARRARRVASTAGFEFPDFEQDYELRRAATSPASTRSSAAASCRAAVSTSPLPNTRSTSPRSTWSVKRAALELSSAAYLVGPLARYALDRRPALAAAREAAEEVGLGAVERTRSCIVVRAVETVYAADEALRIVADTAPDAPFVESCRGPAPGYGCTEAPRGSSTTATRSTRTAPSSTPRSSRRPRRTSGRSRRTSSASSSDRSTSPDDELALPLRAGDPQLRPLHLLRDPLPRARGRAHLSLVVRREPLARRRRGRARGGPPAAGRCPRASSVVEREGEPTALIDDWEGADASGRGRGLARAPSRAPSTASMRTRGFRRTRSAPRPTLSSPRRWSSPGPSAGCRARTLVPSRCQCLAVGGPLTSAVAAATAAVAEVIREGTWPRTKWCRQAAPRPPALIS